MSKFFRALERAQQERANGQGAEGLNRLVTPAQQDILGATSPEPPVQVSRSPLGSGVDEHLVSLTKPTAFEAEQYRALRLRIEEMRQRVGFQVVAVSSPGTSDGKTTTAINLAGALAQTPTTRVLLLDLDLRRPAVAAQLGWPPSTGPELAGIGTDPMPNLDGIGLGQPPFNLRVLPAGAPVASPYETLKSPEMGDLIGQVRQRYDFVVIDAPPMVPVQDCRVLSRWVDGFLLVVRAHRTPRRLLEEALNVMDPAKMLGLVFNGDDESLSGYYAGHYAGYFRRPEANGRGRRWSGSMRRLVSFPKRRGGSTDGNGHDSARPGPTQ